VSSTTSAITILMTETRMKVPMLNFFSYPNATQLLNMGPV
jgi:hypothetical protein